MTRRALFSRALQALPFDAIVRCGLPPKVTLTFTQFETLRVVLQREADAAGPDGATPFYNALAILREAVSQPQMPRSTDR